MKVKPGQYKTTSLAVVMKYMGIVMAVVYILIGLGIMLRAKELFNIPSSYALPLGSILIVYGVFRGYRIYQKYFQ